MANKKMLPILICVISALLSIGLTSPGYACDFTICKFNDLNGNGIQDEGEPNIPGWNIRIYNDMGAAPVAEGYTDENGCWNIHLDVAGITYKVWEEEVECWQATAPAELFYGNDGFYVEVPTASGSIHNIEFGNRYHCPGSCRMTGGNVTVSPALGDDGLETWSYEFKSLDLGEYITTGGQIGAPSGGIPRGHWTHTQHGGAAGSFTFHSGTSSAPDGTEISSIECADPGWCVQARCAPFKQIFWTGIGNFASQHYNGAFDEGVVVPGGPNKGGTLHYYRAMVGDFGENNRPTREIPGQCSWVPPGPYDASEAVALYNYGPDPKFGDKNGQICDTCPDYYQIEIHATVDPSSAVIYEFYGFVEGGNYQIHPRTGEQCPAEPDLVPELFTKTNPGKAVGHK